MLYNKNTVLCIGLRVACINSIPGPTGKAPAPLLIPPPPAVPGAGAILMLVLIVQIAFLQRLQSQIICAANVY